MNQLVPGLHRTTFNAHKDIQKYCQCVFRGPTPHADKLFSRQMRIFFAKRQTSLHTRCLWTVLHAGHISSQLFEMLPLICFLVLLSGILVTSNAHDAFRGCENNLNSLSRGEWAVTLDTECFRHTECRYQISLIQVTVSTCLSQSVRRS